ncbi:unnamed protein product [Allacma fusca]|uniref:Uncharacterized protein n=1 Tax=Allacma fusca TaxID=39272 RepID=A0A8J2LPK7_9HEXA|nr:unnamed protein product [Allacma fusca]
MGPPRPFDKPSRPSSLVESIKSAAANAASSIPGLIHGGLTQLSQYAPFEDPVFGSTSPSPAPTKSSVTLGAPDVETLEYFRKRPHLIKPTSNYVQQGNHFQPSYSSGGFKPVTAPPHFAKSYYASTTTTPSPSSTTGSSHESSHRPPTGRSPKNVQEIRGSGKKENSKEYVDQLVESSNKYKFSATASPFENDLIRHHWKELNEKYTQEDLQEATSNIYSLFSGPSPPSVEQMLYMKPPGHWSRTSTSAFHDLLKMFRLGFSYGQSSTPVRMHYTTHKPYDSYDSYKPKETYSTGNTLRSSTVSETPDRPPSDGWRPLKSTSTFLKEPFLSFNAAISFRSTPKPTSLYPGHGGSHYSTSSKPFVPGKFTALKGVRGNPYSSTSHGSYVDAALADSYSGSSSKGSGGLLNSPYSVSTISPLHHTTSVGSSYGDGESYLAPSGGSLYNDGDSYGSKGSPLTLESYKPPSNTYSGQASGPAKYVSKPSTPDYSDAYYGNHNSNKDSKVKFEAAHVEETYSPPANFASLYENDPGIELIPSSAYYKAKEAGIISSGEIAAVLKPETMSDDDVKSQLRQDVANIPQITYPNGKVPQQLQTLSQLNEYFQTSEPTSQNHVHFQPPLYRIIQQSMQSQNEQLSGLHQQAGVLLNQPVDSQIQELFKAQEQPSSQAQQYADPGVTSFLGNGNHDIQHHHHQMPTQVQHHHTHHVMPEEREQTYEQLHFQPTQEYNKPEQDKQLHYQPAQFIQQHLPQQNIQELLQQHQLQQQHHQQHQLQQQHHQQQQLQHQQHQLQQHQLQEHQQQLQHQQHQYTLPQHLQPQALHRQPPQQVVHKQPSAAKPQQQSGQSGLSFTDFELPPGVDPDIASLLKAELDKDDIPEEFRKEFENQEKAKQQKDQSVGGSNPKPKVVKPPVQRRADAPKTIFHKPIPISPTLLTPSKRGRPPPPQIPKYVLDLARKLRTDKDLQGIVRVTSKKEGGPPIEYLYPVRG